MLNHVVIAGRITKDLELKQTQSGISVLSFQIACDQDFKDKNGERGTDFISISAWRSTAEYISNFFGKGRMIIIDGRLQTREWIDKDGNKRHETEILANSAYFGDSKPSNSGQSQQSNRNIQNQSNGYNQPQNGRFTAQQAYQQQYGQQVPQQNGGFIPDNQDDGTLPF